jgi:hypothetical protein
VWVERTAITPVNLKFDWFDLEENGYFNLYGWGRWESLGEEGGVN